MRRYTLVFLPFLLACGDKDDPGTEYTDADGDGYYAERDDCDDDNASVSPDAEEQCNGVDDNCDGSIDEGVLSTFYGDGDGDGYGDAATPVEGCELSSGVVDDGTDCDDEDADVNPGATEVCDELDNDCDDLVDDDDDSLDTSTATSWYTDLDSDQYGDDDSVVLACEQPVGTVAVGGDCDDVRNGVNPDAEEICDGLDTDCDGDLSADEEDADEDGQRGCEGDCDDAEKTVYDGAEELCDGLDNDCSGAPQDSEADDDGDMYVECVIDEDGWDGQPVDGGEDCDDEDKDAYPGAPEYCDGHDDDCDGDDDEDDSVDVKTWYADSDGDGFGEATDSDIDCYQPSGYVADHTDCDDTDGDVNPDADEICDGVDNDCDNTTSEDGMVTFTDANGTSSDVSSDYGTSSVSSVTLSSDGDLVFCDGTYYALIDVKADVTLSGQSGTNTDVILDGDDSGAILSVEQDGLTVVVEDLTLTGGSDAYGGALFCDSSSSVSLDGVLLEDNYASNTGGAIYSSGCTVELEDCELADNEAGSNGGAAAVMDGGLGLTDSDVYDNVAPYFGGAVLVYGGSIGSASLSLDGTMVSDNDGSLGTIALLGDGGAVSLECVGSSTTSEGLTSNSDDLGALYLADEYAEASIDTCDFGTSSGGDDNDPADVYTMLGNSLSLDNDESIECADGVCALGTFTAGGTTFSYGGASQLRGVVVEATATGFITSLGFNVSGGCDVDLYLASSDSLSGPWSEDYSTTVSNASSGWNDVSTDLLVTSGRYYAAVYGWQACSMTYYDGVSGSDMGFGTYYGITGSSTYGGSLPNLTVSLSNNAYPVRFDVSL